ncbi:MULTISPECIES: glycosyltransferase [unclassified Pseudomonas]|uniref:glycosyltransferase n=1 Tax=unclassified Pseudomonas TaxID=196821 RepID=UPI001475516C|nr:MULTISPECIES: glycosyltransferase [unclassified Pseudomonas]NMY38593.1 glycosyltransferase family 4 protein [Pseudomonas sp. WS 5078]NMY61509.1 glycosyltransferase family 4 protein [Pseudomonas sp. WS 5354]
MKKVLFIQSSLGLGGIETFFVRLVKKLNTKGIRPQFIFLYESKINSGLLSELEPHADVYYWRQLTKLPRVVASEKLRLLLPLDSNKVKELFSHCEAVHVSNALTYLCAKRLASCLDNNLKSVFGIYHANELAWGNDTLPIYESYFRKDLFSSPPMFLFFNDASSLITSLKNNNPKYTSMMFPLGVEIPQNPEFKDFNSPGSIRIVSIGRLVEFKTYNIYMLDVAYQLKKDGVNFSYSIFGSGPLMDQMKSKIIELELSDSVFLEGDLEYADLDIKLKGYDIFIGTGTAVLHAAANGLACITAIENEKGPNSYGFFADLPGYDYHEQGMNFPKLSFYDMLVSYNSLDNEGKVELSERHRKKSHYFNMDACAHSFALSFESAPYINKKNSVFYKFMALFVVCELLASIGIGHKYSKKYEHVL